MVEALEAAASAPVTVVVTRAVKPGRGPDYEAWLGRLITSASTLPGYLGTEVLRPSTGNTWTSIFRFATPAGLRRFEESPARAAALLEVIPIVEGDATWRKLSGVELWFTPPPGLPIPQPSRWRMAIVMTIVVYGLVLSLGAGVAAILGNAPAPLRLFVTIAIEIALMTWVIMPPLTRALARWIYIPPTARRDSGAQPPPSSQP